MNKELIKTYFEEFKHWLNGGIKPLGVIKYFWCVLLKNNSRVSPEFKADSEIECILKASEYILKEINENR